jgi:tetratricopeptide (TPR) repeat protein
MMLAHALLSLWLAWQVLSPPALQHYQAGIAADQQKKFEVAVTEFRQVTEMEPKFADGFIRLGLACIEKQDYSAALAPLKEAVRLDPESLPAHRFLGYALLAQGYAGEAIPHLEKAHETAALGIAQTQAGHLPEAVANLQAALAQRPDDPDLLYYLGRAAGLLSKQSVDTLLTIAPDSARAHQAMAENYFVLRQMPQAEKDYLAALQLRPNMPEVHLELGQVYAATAQWAKAEQQFRAETKLQPGNPEAAYRLGDALLQQGKAREARTELERANQLLPDMPETLYALGKAESLEGDAAAAEKAWARVIALEKDGPLAAQAHFGLAGLYRKQGKAAEAAREMQEFEKLQAASQAGK